MFELACKIPKDIVVAVSGGPDSMALLSFCQAGKKNITVIHIDHATQHSEAARRVLEKYCTEHNLQLFIYDFPRNQPSNELIWRNYRLNIYKTWTSKGLYITTAHHLDDAIEWYILTALHGKPDFMKAIDKVNKLIKPFLYIEKEKLIDWCVRKDVNFVLDPTNIGMHNARAVLRKDVMPGLLQIHPGLKTSIKNKMIEQSQDKE